MIGLVKNLDLICWIGADCGDSMILWDMSAPWDGPTEWS